MLAISDDQINPTCEAEFNAGYALTDVALPSIKNKTEILCEFLVLNVRVVAVGLLATMGVSMVSMVVQGTSNRLPKASCNSGYGL